MKVFERLAKMGFPCQWERPFLGLTPLPGGARRWLQLKPTERDPWVHERMDNAYPHLPGCDHCPTHGLRLICEDDPMWLQSHIGDVCDECGHMFCRADFTIAAAPWSRLGARRTHVVWLPGILIQHRDEFLDWFKGDAPPPTVEPFSTGPFR